MSSKKVVNVPAIPGIPIPAPHLVVVRVRDAWTQIEESESTEEFEVRNKRTQTEGFPRTPREEVENIKAAMERHLTEAREVQNEIRNTLAHFERRISITMTGGYEEFGARPVFVDVVQFQV